MNQDNPGIQRYKLVKPTDKHSWAVWVSSNIRLNVRKTSFSLLRLGESRSVAEYKKYIKTIR